MSSKELQDHAAAMLKQEDDAKVSDPNKRRERWTDDEKALLIEAFKRDPRADAMAAAVGTRSAVQCYQKARYMKLGEQVEAEVGHE